jgi:hypothetical protein
MGFPPHQRFPQWNPEAPAPPRAGASLLMFAAGRGQGVKIGRVRIIESTKTTAASTRACTYKLDGQNADLDVPSNVRYWG